MDRVRILSVFRNNAGGRTAIPAPRVQNPTPETLFGFTPSFRGEITTCRAPVPSMRGREPLDIEGFMDRHERRERDRLRRL